MSISGGPDIVQDGLCELLEASFASSGSFTIASKASQNTFSLSNYLSSSINGNTVLKTNVDSSGAGTSVITVPRNTAVETGAVTFICWFNFEGIPINVGANNNWRMLVSPRDAGGSPFYIVIEQSGVINFSTIQTDGISRRYIDANFSPVSYDTNGWQMVSFTYNNSNGSGSAYKNDNLIRTGPMTGVGGATPTSGGMALAYTNYATNNGFRMYGGTTTVANPNGNGICPGSLGNVMVYNRALSSNEILQNFNALRSRFGV